MKLGRRQMDVLRRAEAGTCSALHQGGGSFVVFGIDDTHPHEVLERLLELGLVEHGGQRIAGYSVNITQAGRDALAAHR